VNARRPGAARCCVALFLAAGMPVQAAEVSVDTFLTGRTEYNDNIALRVLPTPSWRHTIEPGIAFARKTESSQVTARLRLAFNRYTNATFPDADDRIGSISASRDLERGRISIGVDYSLVSTQSAQVLGQTGVNLGFRQVESLIVQPSWTRNLTPRSSLTLAGSVQASRFEQSSLPGNVTNFDTRTLSLSSNHLLGERTNAGLSLSAFDFDTRPSTTRTRSIGLTGNATWRAGERWRWNASLGLQNVETEQVTAVLVCPVDPVLCSLGLVAPVPAGEAGTSRRWLVPFSLGFDWEAGPRSRLTGSIVQRLNPTGAGAVTAGVQANLGYSHALNPRLDATVGLSYITSRTLANATIGDWLSFTPALAWRADEAWTVRTGIIYTRLGYPSIDRHVESTGVFASISYGWTPLRAGL
jgi:hypothetical protein